jgi:spermidine synthase
MTTEIRTQPAGTLLTRRRQAIAKPQLSATAADSPLPRASLAPVAGLLFLSGMCGLVFQVAWFREFRLVFGASTAASSAVLAVFMGGLGLGNAVLGKLADRARRPLQFYAMLELLLGASVALSPVMIDGLRGLYYLIGGQIALGPLLATAFRLAMSALVLGVPTFLMGGTLPAAVRAVTDYKDEQRRGLAILYGANTLGAVAGALGSTFYALEMFGTRHTLWLACIVNVVTALSAMTIARYAARRPLATKALAGMHSRKGRSRLRVDAEESVAISQACTAPVSPRIVYAVAGITGFAFFLMELVWYRMLSPILGGTTFTFGLILAVALAGIGLGGAAYAVLFRRKSASLQSLAFTCALEACCVALPFALGDRLAILAVTLHDSGGSTFFGEVTGWALVASIIILPAAFVSGIQFPLLIALLGQGEKNVGKQLGFAAAWNTMGAICGSLTGGFGLLPMLSATGAWRAAAALLAIVSVCLLVSSRPRARQLWATILTATAAGFALCIIACPGPSAVWRHGAIGAGHTAGTDRLADPNYRHDWENEIRRSVVSEVDGVESSIAIVGGDGLAFHVNGMCDGNAVDDVGTQVMLGLIGAAIHPHPQSAVVVGLGTGETAGWLADVPSIERVDVIELEPAVQEMARRCRAVNRDVLANPKVRMIINDAREVLLTAARRYDLIVCEPSNPYRSGIANLFTQEFYHAGRDRLNEGGMFVQWVQAYEIDERTMRMVFATFKSIFPHVEVWQSKAGDLVLVGSAKRPECSVDELRGKLAAEPFATALRCAWHTTGVEGLFSHYVGGPALVDHFLGKGSATINTDDRNEIEYGFARTLGRAGWDAVGTLSGVSAEIGDDRPAVTGDGVDWRMASLDRQWGAAVDGKSHSADETRLNSDLNDEVLRRYLAKDARGMIAAWELSANSTPCLTELAVIAHLYAQAGSEKAGPLIEQLRKQLPGEAEALRGILAWRKGRLDESADHLAAAFLRLRSDPWVLEHIRTKMFDAAVQVAKANPGKSARLLDALSEPFAANCADESRRATACVLAERVGPVAVARYVESFEPNVPWTDEFLTYRQRIYREAGHRLAAQADRDSREFARYASRATNVIIAR